MTENTIIHFVLYARSYCHLCDDMREALRVLLGGVCEYTIDVLDVDSNEAFLVLYDERVPVLFGVAKRGGSVELCHYFLDEVRLRNFIASWGEC